MAERRSGFGSGFAKDVEWILAAAQMRVIYQDEVRANLRIAGMILRTEAEMPVFQLPEPQPEFDETEYDDQEVTDE